MPDRKSARLEVRLTQDLRDRVETEAGRLGQSLSVFVERALESALRNEAPVMRVTIDESVVNAKPPTREEVQAAEEKAEAEHVEKMRVEIARQFVPPKPVPTLRRASSLGKGEFNPRPKGGK
jgi:hypothetical protein